ncbi:MAG: zinc-binding dehydrogenase [Vicinamibacteria bacterium]|nr:zinc-binding dehydrogenase [Vicinamibacteria bacterium]
MQAALIRTQGSPEVLELADIDPPKPGPSEALVRVRACALNHLDLWTRSGRAGYTPPLPHVLGSDIAGVIESLPSGADTTGLAVGQRVMLQPGTSCGRCAPCLSGDDFACRRYQVLGHGRAGGYAEYVAAPLANLIPIPESISFENAAAFPLVFLTAWRMLVVRAQVKMGEDVLVWAAGSGVGMAAIQIAKLMGARVIATAGGEEKLELARRLGADVVVDHYKGDVVAQVKTFTSKKGAEVVIEHTGEKTWERSIQSLSHRGRLVTCGATSGPTGSTDLRFLFAKHLNLMGSYMGSRADLLAAASHFFGGRLKTLVHATVPLERAADAHRMMEASEHFGKIVLTV